MAVNAEVWFRLTVRALGLLFLGLGAPYLWYFVIYSVEASVAAGAQETGPSVHPVFWAPYYVVQPCLGVYLLFFGERLIQAYLRDARRAQAAAAGDERRGVEARAAAPTPARE